MECPQPPRACDSGGKRAALQTLREVRQHLAIAQRLIDQQSTVYCLFYMSEEFWLVLVPPPPAISTMAHFHIIIS